MQSFMHNFLTPALIYPDYLDARTGSLANLV